MSASLALRDLLVWSLQIGLVAALGVIIPPVLGLKMPKAKLIFLQLVLAIGVGVVAHKVSLVAAFAILACVYGMSFVAASWPIGTQLAEEVAAK